MVDMTKTYVGVDAHAPGVAGSMSALDVCAILFEDERECYARLDYVKA